MSIATVPLSTFTADRIDLVFLRNEVHFDAELGVPMAAGELPRYRGFGASAVVDFPMTAELDEAQLGRLAAICAAHTGDHAVNDPEALRLGRYVSPASPLLRTPDWSFDFRLTRLHKIIGKRDAGGFVTRWDWTALVDMGGIGVRSEVVIQERHTYALTPDGFTVLNRANRLEALRNDGTPHATVKEWPKHYVSDDASHTAYAQGKEGSKRRGALVNEAKGTVGAWLVANGYPVTQGQEFVSALGFAKSLYVEESKPTILDAVRDVTGFSWLDDPNGMDETLATPVRDGTAPTGALVTPRDYVRGLLNIYGIPL